MLLSDATKINIEVLGQNQNCVIEMPVATLQAAPVVGRPVATFIGVMWMLRH